MTEYRDVVGLTCADIISKVSLTLWSVFFIFRYADPEI